MGKWKECTIDDIGTVVGGATPSTKKIENYENGTISWITPRTCLIFQEGISLVVKEILQKQD